MLEHNRSIIIQIPEIQCLKKHIGVSSACELTKQEFACFAVALRLLAEEMELDGIIGDADRRVSIYFLDSGTITLTSTNPDSLGEQHAFILYHVDRWRIAPREDLQLITIMLEELCHGLYYIRNEAKVKLKVLEILRRNDPDVPLDVINGKYIRL